GFRGYGLVLEQETRLAEGVHQQAQVARIVFGDENLKGAGHVISRGGPGRSIKAGAPHRATAIRGGGAPAGRRIHGGRCTSENRIVCWKQTKGDSGHY